MADFSGAVSLINAMEKYYAYSLIDVNHESTTIIDFTGTKSVYFVQIKQRPTVGQIYPTYSGS